MATARQLLETSFHTEVLEGDKLAFVFFYVLTHLSNFLNRKAPRIGSLLRKGGWFKSRTPFVIKNKTGVFQVTPFGDSMTISADYFESHLKGWLGKPAGRHVMVDIGANIGRYSLLAKNSFGYKKVLCVEANPRTFSALNKNIALNGSEQEIVAVCTAAGNHKGEVGFQDNPRDSGMSHILASDEAIPFGDNLIKVPIDMMDDILVRHDIPYKDIDFVKIDVEGFDFEVLEGMRQFLEESKEGTCMMIEMSDRKPEEAMRLLAQHRFELIGESASDHLFQKKSTL